MEKQKLMPGMKWQRKSKSAQGDYWYDVEKGRHINNARFLRNFILRQVPITLTNPTT